MLQLIGGGSRHAPLPQVPARLGPLLSTLVEISVTHPRTQLVLHAAEVHRSASAGNRACILALDHLCLSNFFPPSAVCIHHPPLWLGLWGYHDGAELSTAVHYAFVSRKDTSHGKTSKKTRAGSTGCGPPKLGEIGKAVADAGYSKSMALLLAT